MRMRLIDTLLGGEPDLTPIWLMRQAGRYLPGYRKLKEKHSIMEIVTDPRLAPAATLEPLKLFDLDAGIVFSDIAVPLRGLGVDFRLDAGTGPVILSPVRTEASLRCLPPFDAKGSAGLVGKTIRMFHEASDRPIFGFSASPFTLACYLIEGQHRQDFPMTRAKLGDADGFFPRLMKELSEVTFTYLRMQENAGADALQIFDTWAGILSPRQFRTLVVPHLQEIVGELGAPVIYFSTASSHLLPEMRSLGAAGIGVDWRIPLDRARKALGDKVVLQGNLDPAALLGSREEMEREAAEVLREHPARMWFDSPASTVSIGSPSKSVLAGFWPRTPPFPG